MPRHKHADLIHAFAEGAEIQKFDGAEWWDDPFPEFFPDVKYRIKPRTVKREGWVNIYRVHNPQILTHLCCVYTTEEEAKTFAGIEVVDTVKVEWLEDV